MIRATKVFAIRLVDAKTRHSPKPSIVLDFMP